MLICAVSAMVKTSRPEASVTPRANDSVGAAASGTQVTSCTWNSGAIRPAATASGSLLIARGSCGSRQ